MKAPPTRSGWLRRAAVTISLVATLIVATGCAGNQGIADQYRAGTNKGYISGDGRIVEIPVEARGDPVDFEGVIETGDTVTSDQYRGEVLVVNFWYAACGPCRVEAPILESVYQEFQGKGAEFLGVNTYDQSAVATSFAGTFGIGYPSVIDAKNAEVKFAFAQVVPVQATPTTLVLDKQGRVAARISGQLDSASTLRSLIEDAIAEEQ